MYLHNLLIFVGCLVSYVQSQKICKKNQYTEVKSDGSFICLNCETCHEGRGLYPLCGSRIPYPAKPDCMVCPEGTFSDELDSAPCHSCQMCAEHEIVTAPCTSHSNRVCNGTCEAGFFYSKKDSTHSCQKCAYCCSDGKDEVISECINQGLNASKKHCRPRPDRECNPGSSLPSPTDSLVGNEASESGSVSTAIIILIVLGVVSSVIIVTLVICLLYRTRKKQRRVPVAESYSQNGPTTAPPNTASNAEMSAAFHKEPDSTTVTVGGVNSGADLHVGLAQNNASEQATQIAASSVPSGSNSESVVRTPVKLDAGKDNTNDKMSGDTPTVLATDAASPDGKVPISGDAVASDLKETTGGRKRRLSRQLSKDSQRSDNEAGPGGWKRSPSTSSFTEMLRRRSLSKKDEVKLVTNEEEDTDESQGPIEIIQEPSPQEVKQGSKLRLVFKCKVRGDGKLTYQWYKDDTKLPGKNEDTLVLKSVMLRDFGLYTCNCGASCKDGSSYSKDSLLVEVDVTPRDGMTYKCLKDLDLNTQDRIEDLLSQKKYSVGGCMHIASWYRMDQHKIKNLENDPEAGKKVLEYLGSSNPDLTVYEFCKTLKTREIKRLDIVKELLEHLSVPSSSNVYV